MILAYPFLVLFGPSIMLVYLLFKAATKKNDVVKIVAAIFVSPFVFILGLIFDICWTPVALIALPVYFIFMLFTTCIRTIKGRRRAMRRINDIIENN